MSRLGAMDAAGGALRVFRERATVQTVTPRELADAGELFAVLERLELDFLAIHASALAELGLPLELETPRPGERAANHPWLEGVRGISRRALGPSIELGDRELLVGAWQDGAGDPFAICADGRELLEALRLFRDALDGWEFRHSAMMTGWRLMHGLWKYGRRKARLEALDWRETELPDLLGGGEGDRYIAQIEVPYGSWLPERRGPIGELIGGWDVNGQRLAACSRLPLGFGRPERLEAPELEHVLRSPGYHRVVSVKVPYRGRIPDVFDPGWHTTPRVKMAAALGLEPIVIESWVWPQQLAYLDPFYERLRDARTALHELKRPNRAADAAGAAVKLCYLLPFGRLRSAKSAERKDLWHRPAWYDHIIGAELAREYLRLHQLAEAGRHVVAVYFDTIIAETVNGAAPPELPVSSQLGKYSPVGGHIHALEAGRALARQGSVSDLVLALKAAPALAAAERPAEPRLTAAGELEAVEDQERAPAPDKGATVAAPAPIAQANSERSVIGDELLSTGKAAKALGVSINTVRRWRRAGMLPYAQLPNGHYRYPRAALEQILRDRRGDPPPPPAPLPGQIAIGEDEA